MLRKLVYFTIFTLTLSFANISHAYIEVNAYNSAFCHGCDDISYKTAAINKSKNLKFIQDEYGEPEYNYVNILDIQNGKIKSYVVTRMESPFFPELVYVANDVQPDPEVVSEWFSFSQYFDDFFSNPFESEHNGYDFLTDYSVRSSVTKKITDSWYTFILAPAQTFRLIDGLVGILPDNAFYNRIKVEFADGVELVLSIQSIEQLTIQDLFSGTVILVYVQDSAYIVDEDGTLVKLPDDKVEADLIQKTSFTSISSAKIFLKFVSSLRSVGAETCNTKQQSITDKDGVERVEYVIDC